MIPPMGPSQLSFFNGHYDSWCYLPVMNLCSSIGGGTVCMPSLLLQGNARAFGP